MSLSLDILNKNWEPFESPSLFKNVLLPFHERTVCETFTGTTQFKFRLGVVGRVQAMERDHGMRIWQPAIGSKTQKNPPAMAIPQSSQCRGSRWSHCGQMRGLDEQRRKTERS